MKIEKLKPQVARDDDPISVAIRALKPGDCIRLKTAHEYRAVNGMLARIGNQIGVKFRTRSDGSDVLVFIKDKP